jgi:hypothetical protein
MDHNDLLQNELAFNAFARAVIDVLLEGEAISPTQISTVLRAQASELESNENFGAAHTLMLIAEFAERRGDARKVLKSLEPKP